MPHLQYERMSPVFDKWHLREVPFTSSIHHLKGPDAGPPHDHPFGFTSFILQGWYEEHTYDQRGEVTSIIHKAGTCHLVHAQSVHRIVTVSEGGCWTIIRQNTPYYRVPRFWTFENGIASSKEWHEI